MARLVDLRELGCVREDLAAGGKVRRADELEQLSYVQAPVVDQRNTAVDHLAEVVRRDARRHADRDALRPVDQQIRKPRRQHDRLELRSVVVGAEVDGTLGQLAEELHRDLVEAGLGVPHRRRRIAFERAEVAESEDQRRTHDPILGHPNQRLVDRRIAVGVIPPHHVADDTGALLRLAVRPQVQAVVHQVEDAPMDRLEAVTDIGQRPGRDDADRVAEVQPLGLGAQGHFGERSVHLFSGVVRTAADVNGLYAPTGN